MDALSMSDEERRFSERQKILVEIRDALTGIEQMRRAVYNLASAKMVEIGLAGADLDFETGTLKLRAPTDADRARMTPVNTTSPDRILAGTTLPNKGTVAWVFSPPASLSPVKLVCALDEESPIGYRAEATVARNPAERIVYQAEWKEVRRIT